MRSTSLSRRRGAVNGEARRPTELDELDAELSRWFASQLDENPIVLAVDRDPTAPRQWFVRVKGEAKDVFTIRFHLRQRTLGYETYVMPAPEENHAEFFAHLLRRNLGLYGASFSIGEEDAIFLQGHIDNRVIDDWVERGDDAELDRVLGSMYVWVERFFRPALAIGFASRFGS